MFLTTKIALQTNLYPILRLIYWNLRVLSFQLNQISTVQIHVFYRYGNTNQVLESLSLCKTLQAHKLQPH